MTENETDNQRLVKLMQPYARAIGAGIATGNHQATDLEIELFMTDQRFQFKVVEGMQIAQGTFDQDGSPIE